MIDFTKLTGIEHDGKVVTQIEDSAGRVLWAVQSNEPIVLEVEKVISDTYAGETTYTAEEFILLDIYPKTNGTVSVTYGGLTKTITDTSGAEEPNAQQVFFGTFNGVSDNVATPASGALTIAGDCIGVGTSKYTTKKSTYAQCACITDVTDWGGITNIVDYAFYKCTALALTELPSVITRIGAYAFYDCSGISIGEIPEGVTEIGAYAFSVGQGHSMPDTIVLPSTVVSIGDSAFATSIASGIFNSVANKIIIRATTPPTIGNNVFGEGGEGISVNIPDEIIVPTGCGETYKAAEGWSVYADRIMEAS